MYSAIMLAQEIDTGKINIGTLNQVVLKSYQY
jgi:hypothetical protein